MGAAVRSTLLLVLSLAACGRTDLIDEPAVDSGVLTPPTPPVVVKDPLAVFVVDGSCAKAGTKDALKPGVDERVFAVEFLAQEECSGAGGDWLIGRELGGVREVAMGDHACWFMPDDYRAARVKRYGVVRSNLLAVTTQVPDGWCLTTVDGRPLPKTDVNVLAFGVYESETAARDAARALK